MKLADIANRPKMSRRFLDDVEQLAEAACETAEDLHARGLGQLAVKLERALVRLGGGR